MTERLSAKIANIAFVCAILVVTIHATRPLSSDLAGRVLWNLTRGGVSRIAVPFFFVFSGYFLARHFGKPGWWGEQMARRVRTLLVPYCIWSAIVFIQVILVDGIAPWYDIRTLRGFTRVTGLNLCAMPLFGAMWYVRALLLFALVSPVLFLVVRKTRGWALPVLFLAYAILAPGEPPAWLVFPKGLTEFFRAGFSLEGLFFFCLGAHLFWHPVEIRRGVGLWCGVVGGLLVVLRLVCVFKGWPMPICLRTLFIPALMVAVWVYAPSSRWPATLLAATFPIYVMHGLVIKLTRVYVILPHTSVFWIAQIALAVLIAVSISGLVHRFAPRVASVLWGGR